MKELKILCEQIIESAEAEALDIQATVLEDREALLNETIGNLKSWHEKVLSNASALALLILTEVAEELFLEPLHSKLRHKINEKLKQKTSFTLHAHPETNITEIGFPIVKNHSVPRGKLEMTTGNARHCFNVSPDIKKFLEAADIKQRVYSEQLG